MTDAPKIVVIGSINMDLVIRCTHLPAPGETILANSSAEVSGGKGANQAVAAARMAGSVSMIGAVGDDAFGSQLKQNLIQEQIDCTRVQQIPDCPSGLAVVAVDETGENSIMVCSGANSRIDAQTIESHADRIASANVLLLQLEIPVAAVACAIRIAQQHNVPILLDPAPAPETVFPELYAVDFLCPNQSEAEQILGITIHSINEAFKAAELLHKRGVKNVLLTLGDQGLIWHNSTTSKRIQAHQVITVDTTAAGDAFAGAFAVRWAVTHDIEASIKTASIAGALAASRSGAQPSLPTASEVFTLSSHQSE